MSETEPMPRRRRGRPPADSEPIATREEILDLALEAFADLGYHAASIRELTRRLNVSHGLFHAKFGSKMALWKAAVDHGMRRLVQQLDVAAYSDRMHATPEERLREVFVSLLLGLDQAPAVLRLMNYEGLQQSDRLEYIYERYMTIGSFQGDVIIDEGVKAGVFRDVSRPTIFFLLAHGGGAVFSLRALASKLGLPQARSKKAARARAEEVADTLIRGILVDRR
ncbi:TetR/AcrR family transcriptional regulator [Sphingopyxis granuli]|uniref:TetR/AcrR family transcriptional regulator n=1 Tax=Sphingopyxis granuli TaxID=267128 RepID=UPI001BAF8411|nr:TetR/AcrR family transcriptional regulator [Sphingopyxis granuli]QUM74410.1 TetR/AcrR family transcriptional regulator [Sphingopyxis granuli]